MGGSTASLSKRGSATKGGASARTSMSVGGKTVTKNSSLTFTIKGTKIKVTNVHLDEKGNLIGTYGSTTGKISGSNLV